MNISPIQQNNTSFGKLNAPRKLKLTSGTINRKELLKYPSIKECADKFDVVVKKLRREKSDSPNPLLEWTLNSIIPVVGTLVTIVTYKMQEVLGLSSAICTVIFSTLNAKMFKSYNYDVYSVYGQKKYNDGNELKTAEHIVTSLNGGYSVQDIPNLAKELEYKHNDRFLKLITDKYPADGNFDVKTILQILQSKEIKNDYQNGEAFNLPIDVKGESTLLQKFFDLRRTEENRIEYDKIASIIKSTPNVNFHQKDSAGISILENVLNYENPDALEVIKDVEFEYSKYLDDIYGFMMNEDFKSKARGLNIKFNRPEKALFENKSMQAFKRAVTQFDSPFCNSVKLASDIWFRAKEHLGNEELKEINLILHKYLPEHLRFER